jgi:hypothetical protein
VTITVSGPSTRASLFGVIVRVAVAEPAAKVTFAVMKS